MTNRDDIDPLVGNELIEVSLHPHHVHFTFSEVVLQLGVPFEISIGQSRTATIDPTEKNGNLTTIWSLVGRVVSAVKWTEKIEIKFTDGAAISIGPAEGRPRGTIMGRHDMTIEDF